VPNSYKKLENQNVNIIQLPLTTNYSFDHEEDGNEKYGNNKIINKNSFIKNYENLEMKTNIPIIKGLLFMNNDWDKKRKFKLQNFYHKDYYNQIGDSVLDYYGVKNILIHKKYYEKEELENLKDFINEKISIKELYEDDLIINYSIKESEKKLNYIAYKDKNWGKTYGYKKYPPYKLKTAVKNNSTLRLINIQENNYSAANMKFTVDGCKNHIRFLELSLDNKNIKKIKIDGKNEKITIELNDINKQESLLQFKIYDENMKEIFEDKECKVKISDVSVK
jgi:hypothetical protein